MTVEKGAHAFKLLLQVQKHKLWEKWIPAYTDEADML